MVPYGVCQIGFHRSSLFYVSCHSLKGTKELESQLCRHSAILRKTWDLRFFGPVWAAIVGVGYSFCVRIKDSRIE